MKIFCRARFVAAKQKGAHPLHLRASAFALVVGYSFYQKNTRCQNETSFSHSLSQFFAHLHKNRPLFPEKSLLQAWVFPYIMGGAK
uniref:hypothetical protein n=1 Tax=Gemmiger formicilis TaxID=745368 RepID=UPI004025D1E9